MGKERIGRLLIPLWLAWPIGYGVLLLSGMLIQGEAWVFPLTFFGLDGYLANYFSIRSWHVVGEWYTGALILVILVTPLIRYALRCRGISNVVVVLLCLELFVGIFVDSGDSNILWRSLPVCVVSYVMGMKLCQLKNASFYDVHNKLAWIISFGLLIFSYVFRSVLSGNYDALGVTLDFQAKAVAYFMLMELISDFLGRLRILRAFHGSMMANCVVLCSKGSYQFYLFQHVSIYFVLHFASIAAGGAYVSSASVLVLLLLSVMIAVALSFFEFRIESCVRTNAGFLR